MDNSKTTYRYESQYGGDYEISPKIGIYANNDNLYVGFDYFDKEYECWDPFCSATVNTIPLCYMEAAIDTNNNGTKILDFLESAGFGKCTHHVVGSGFCAYPIFKFNEEKIRQIDPEVFAEYQKAHGRDKLPLDQAIHDASAKTVKAGPEPEAKDHSR